MKVTCEVCGKEMNMITNSHLSLHKMTPEDYRNRYPGAPMFDEEMRKVIHKTRHRVERPKCLHPKCENTVTESYNIFCSPSCRSSYNFSKEYRNLQSGDRCHFYVDGRSIAKNDRIRENRKYESFHKTRRGFWKKHGDEQKKLAKERDNFTCQKCGVEARGKSGHVHHIVAERCFDDPHLAHDLSNLVTLCSQCHNYIEADTKRALHKQAVALEKILTQRPELYDIIRQDDPDFELFSEFKEFIFDFRNKNKEAA
jgi:5-methylcytosine-specific restriction endonuclease McrA